MRPPTGTKAQKKLLLFELIFTSFLSCVHQSPNILCTRAVRADLLSSAPQPTRPATHPPSPGLLSRVAHLAPMALSLRAIKSRTVEGTLQHLPTAALPSSLLGPRLLLLCSAHATTHGHNQALTGQPRASEPAAAPRPRPAAQAGKHSSHSSGQLGSPLLQLQPLGELIFSQVLLCLIGSLSSLCITHSPAQILTLHVCIFYIYMGAPIEYRLTNLTSSCSCC